MISLTENPEMQEKMKEKLEELKDSELSKKGKSAYETVVNDEATKKVLDYFLNDLSFLIYK